MMMVLCAKLHKPAAKSIFKNAIAFDVFQNSLFGLCVGFTRTNRWQQQLFGFQFKDMKLKCKNDKNKRLHSQKSKHCFI